MTAIDFILDGLEAALALERELGNRIVELESRDFLARAPQPAAPQRAAAQPLASPAAPIAPTLPAAPQRAAVQPSNLPSPPPSAREQRANSAPSATPGAPSAAPAAGAINTTIVFLHHRALAGASAEMIERIKVAMGAPAAGARVVWEGALPAARFYVVLGDRARRQWFPDHPARPGMWISGAHGEQALVTYSPDYFLRFSEVTEGVKKIKHDMWKSLLGLLGRL